MESRVTQPKDFEVYPAEDVTMDASGPNKEPVLNEPRVPEEILNALRVAVLRIHRNLG